MLQGMHHSRVIQVLTRGPSTSLGTGDTSKATAIEQVSLQPLKRRKGV